jgi:hypothetical protein
LRFTSIEIIENLKIGPARVICENFYGRMKILWGDARNRVKNGLGCYENVITICDALTNLHLKYHH